MNSVKYALFLLLAAAVAIPSLASAALIDRVNEAFRTIHSRTPTLSEWEYWAGRVQRGEKTTFDALVGAIAFQNVHNSQSAGSPGTIASTVPSSDTFRTSPSAYPSSHNPNFHPEGTLVTSPSTPNVYYVQNGKKSWVTPNVLNRWLNENHFYKHDIIITVSDAELARYPQSASVNPIYIGKVLVHPTGAQFYIDDKYRRRPLSASVRAALKIPAGNLYPTSAVHLQEFRSGPALTGNEYPGGFVVYTGPYHGGRFWKFEEIAGGAIVKRLYLSDYLYEADGNPDESHRAPAVAALFDKHGRGANIERYPSGWVVGIGPNIYVVENEHLRLITSPDIFAAMGYKSNYILTVFPEFLIKYPHAASISAFKSLVAGSASALKGGAAPAPDTASHLLRVRPHVRTMINEMNTTYISVFGIDVTPAENSFWVNYVYNGEVNNKTDLIAAMQRTKTTGVKPSLTPRTTPISLDKLKSHWFPYLFYFVHQQEPTDADRAYWFSRITTGDRDTIEKLGGTIQWLKDTQGATRR